jgi:hypothetical protein
MALSGELLASYVTLDPVGSWLDFGVFRVPARRVFATGVWGYQRGRQHSRSSATSNPRSTAISVSICRVNGVELPIFEASQKVDVVHVLLSDEVRGGCQLGGLGPCSRRRPPGHALVLQAHMIAICLGPLKSPLRAYYGPLVKAAATPS